MIVVWGSSLGMVAGCRGPEGGVVDIWAVEVVVAGF